MNLYDLTILGTIALGLLGSFAGLLLLARYNRKAIAVVILVLGLIILTALTVLYLVETNRYSKILYGLFAITHIAYLVSGFLGWLFGKWWRRASRGAGGTKGSD